MIPIVCLFYANTFNPAAVVVSGGAKSRDTTPTNGVSELLVLLFDRCDWRGVCQKLRLFCSELCHSPLTAT
jgi:hypothetical protein